MAINKDNNKPKPQQTIFGDKIPAPQYKIEAHVDTGPAPKVEAPVQEASVNSNTTLYVSIAIALVAAYSVFKYFSH
jgi:hypothetical protein